MLPDDKGWFHYTEVKEECFFGDQRPDIVVKGPAGTLHIEIAVTHFIDETKLAKIILARYNTLEIDLSGLDYHTGIEDLEKILIEETYEKDLVFWNNSPGFIPVTKQEYDWKDWAIFAGIIIGALWLLNCIGKWLRKK